jgi:hypothetical protein
MAQAGFCEVAARRAIVRRGQTYEDICASE